MIMPPRLLDAILDGPFEFTARPEPIPGDLRRAWGIAVVVLILGGSRGKRASLQKLHFMAHAVRTPETRQRALQVFGGALRPADVVVRVEPWLNRAVAFAKGGGLIELDRGKRAKLTQCGLDLLTVLSAEGVLPEEKAFIRAVGAKATEGAIEKIMRMDVSL
jgi:hypothetical protein